MAPIRIAIVGLGKIARDQHLPALAGNDAFTLAAIASRNARLDGVPSFGTIDELLASTIAFDAVSLCTPPPGRFAQARAALRAGKHVFLEKPPGASVSEIGALVREAAGTGASLFASWHSRFAPCVEEARLQIAERGLRAVHVNWKEDVRHWHPGQAWIWEPGGLGVFDPGINALSIVTHILPEPMHLTRADLSFPANRAAPIAASLAFETAAGHPVTAEFDWRQTGPQSWDIVIETDGGTLTLAEGGSQLSLDGEELCSGQDREYPGLYAGFAELVRDGRSEVDVAPFLHVADAFMLARRHEVEPFEDDAP